jgi:hypothetical protein
MQQVYQGIVTRYWQGAAWCANWVLLGCAIIVSQVMLTIPFAPLVWLLWNWIAVRLGAPALSFIEVAGLVLLVKMLGTNAMMGRSVQK